MLETLLPPGMDVLVGVALMGISFLGSFITAAFGIGGGVVVLAVLATLLPPAALIPVHGVVQFGSNAGRTLIMRAHINRAILGVFLIGTLAGVILGGLLVVELPPAIVQVAVGAFILWTIFFKPPGFIRRSAMIAGGFSSFLTMFFGATGPFVAAYLRTHAFAKMVHVATHAACMTAQHGLKIVAFGILGFAFGPYIPLIVGMIGFGFLGTLAGRRVLMKIDEKIFNLGLKIILILLALRLIWAGATSF